MKGKHGQSAAIRREWQELEARARAAEVKVEALEKSLDAARSEHARKFDALKRENDALRRDAERAASPHLADLHRLLDKVTAERDQAQEHMRYTRDHIQPKLVDALVESYVRQGMSRQDAVDTMTSVITGANAVVSDRNRHMPGEDIAAKQRAVRAMDQKGHARSAAIKEDIVARYLAANDTPVTRQLDGKQDPVNTSA